MRYALIGCGMISPSHLRAALDAELEIAALCDVSEECRQRALALLPEERRGAVRLYADYRQMLTEVSPALTAIALGSGAKRDIACACMTAGSHVIVEKPVALSLSEAEEMLRCARTHGVKLCVNHQLRFCPSVRGVKAAAEAGRFGKMYHAAAQIRRNRGKAYFDAAPWRGTWDQDGGALMNQCIHYTDLLGWVLGEPEEVFAYTDRLAHPYIQAEDMGLAVVKFKSGAYAMIEGTVNVYPDNLSDAMAFFGEKGCVSLGGKYLNQVERWQFSDGAVSMGDTLAEFDIRDMGAGHAPVYRDMLAAIREDREPLCSGAEGKKALELVLGIYASAAAGQPLRFPLEGGATTDYTGRFEP